MVAQLPLLRVEIVLRQCLLMGGELGTETNIALLVGRVFNYVFTIFRPVIGNNDFSSNFVLKS